MTTTQKIDLVRSILDELATVGYLSNQRYKLQSLQNIRTLLSDFSLPVSPTKADATIQSIKMLSTVNNCIDKQLSGLSELSEKALTELHKE